MKPFLTYLRHQQIDKAAWDACIRRAGNGLIYGYSEYLDRMTTAWDGVVMNDYEAVMPLPWRRKWGISYLYQPFAVAQLGVFGNGLSADTVRAFLEAVPTKFRYWDYTLNHSNQFSIAGFPFYSRMNYVLPLQLPYETLQQHYRENIRRNVKKSTRYGNTPIRDVSLDALIDLTQFQSKPLPVDEVAAFKKLCQHLQTKGVAKIYGVLSKQGDLLASAVFFFSHRRAYYILVGNHPNGRTLGASHALIDAFIRDHAGQDLLLDFEGSDLRNLAFFYQSFGAKEESFPAIKLNCLPWWGRWLKR